MSKKAEELAVEITGLSPKSYDVGSKIRAEAQTRLDRVTTRIDDFARKERELTAQRVRKLAENTMDNIPLIDAIAAILANEED